MAASASTPILGLSFNQDAGCFAVALETGFRIYNTDPLKLRQEHVFETGASGIRHVAMLYRCNYLGLLGGGRAPRLPRSQVWLFDDFEKQCELQFDFKSEVLNVQLRREHIVIVLRHEVHVYTLSAEAELVVHVDTAENPLGLCAVCPSSTTALVAFPAKKKGSVVLLDLNSLQQTIVSAHTSPLACLAINAEGTMLATASETGTLVHVFDTGSGSKLRTLRRGTQPATVFSIAFDVTSEWLAFASERTIHVCSMTKTNTKSMLSYVPIKYLQSEWSHAKFQPDTGGARTLVAFGADPHTIIVISESGVYYRACFDPDESGDCVVEEHARFID